MAYNNKINKKRIMMNEVHKKLVLKLIWLLEFLCVMPQAAE